MNAKPNHFRVQRERGFVFILLLVIVGIAAITALTVNLWGGNDPKSAEQKVTQAALEQAKEAVLSYLIQNGRLPCPTDVTSASGTDASLEGAESIYCGGAGISKIGLIPWKKLGIAAPRDSHGNCIWYAVSGNVKSSSKSYPINADTDGTFQIRDLNGNLLVGNTLDAKANAMAIFIAPNLPLISGSINQNQIKTTAAAIRPTCPLPDATSASAVAQQYLDNATITVAGTSTVLDNWNIPTTAIPALGVVTTKTFIQGHINGVFLNSQINDQLYWITAEEFGLNISRYAAKKIADSLKVFYNQTGYKSYPSPSSSINGICDSSLNKGYLPQSCPTLDTVFNVVSDTWKNNQAKDLVNPTTGDNWHQFTHYALSSKCKIGTLNCGDGAGTLTIDQNANLHTIAIVRGRGVNCATPQACIENPNNVIAANNINALIYESPIKTKNINPFLKNNDVIGFTK